MGDRKSNIAYSSHGNMMILLTIILMDLLTGMEFDLFVPSFPALQQDFHLSPSWVTALLSANFVGYCVSLVFLGDLADKCGRKLIMLLGLIIFVVGSAACLWPLSYTFLLMGRFLQGLGIAAPAILSFLVIADIYPLKDQQVIMGILNGSMNLAVAAAPVAGSYITHYFHWQGNFVVLLWSGIFVLVLTALFIPPNTAIQEKEAETIYGIRGYLSILQSRPLVLLMTNLLLTFVPYWIFVGISPLLFIKSLGVTLKYFGYYQGSLAFAFGIGSIMYGFMIKHLECDQQSMLRISIGIFSLSIALLGIAAFYDSTSPIFITVAMLVYVIGQIIPSTILYPICLNFLPHAKGRVSALIQGARLILTSIGLQIASYFYVGTFQNVGIILLLVILGAVVTLHFVTRNQALMHTRL